MAETLNVRPLRMELTGLKRDALAGEVAVVTGGGSNIGLGTTRSLAWLGANVIIAQRSAETGEAACALINQENKPGTAMFVQTDVTSEESVNALARRAFDTFGKVDIFLSNAMAMGIGGNTILSTTPADLDKQYATSTRGTLLGLRAFVPEMKKRKHGVVAYLATAFRTGRGGSTYFATKAGTSSMLMGVAAELGDVKDSGVAVFMLVPGWVSTPKRTEEAGPARTFRGLNVGYEGAMPPEDLGAALAYAIVHAAEIHGSGITVGQVHKLLNWPFPNPELVPAKDFDRIRDGVAVRLFGYLGPGFPNPKDARVSVNRSDAAPGEGVDFLSLTGVVRPQK